MGAEGLTTKAAVRLHAALPLTTGRVGNQPGQPITNNPQKVIQATVNP